MAYIFWSELSQKIICMGVTPSVGLISLWIVCIQTHKSDAFLVCIQPRHYSSMLNGILCLADSCLGVHFYNMCDSYKPQFWPCGGMSSGLGLDSLSSTRNSTLTSRSVVILFIVVGIFLASFISYGFVWGIHDRFILFVIHAINWHTDPPPFCLLFHWSLLSLLVGTSRIMLHAMPSSPFETRL